MDIAQRKVWRDGAAIELTSVEFDILDLLIRSAGRIVTRAELTEKMYGRQPSGFDRAIDVHICHLRRKLESQTPLIRTIRGAGYQFCPTRSLEAGGP
jgi:two-component system response regulator CpxR